MKKIVLIFIITLSLFTKCSTSNNSEFATDEGFKKARTIITTDGEVDDQNSFIRMLLYLNEFQVEGLIYSSSQWHWKGDGEGTLYTSETRQRQGPLTNLRWTGVTWMQEMIDKYAEVYDNLQKHDINYPSPEYLKSIIRIGNIDFEGDMAEATEGSDFIKDILLDDEEGPVYVQIWGGTNTLARALKSIEEEYKGTSQWDKVYKKVSDKTFIYTVLDQDATYSSYVAPNWPEIRVIYNSAQFWSFAYMWSRVVPQDLKPFLQGQWMSQNILFDHGPLTAAYYTWGDNRQIEGDPDHNHGDMEQVEARGMNQYDFISEGDSPAYFFLLNYGFRSTEDPSYGGLGGRFVLSETNNRRWEDGENVTDLNPTTKEQDSSYPQIRWVEVLQEDFAARADRCVMEYEEANHPPLVSLKNNGEILAKPGQSVILEGVAKDPDGDELMYNWWQYIEAGTFTDKLEIKDFNTNKAEVVIPETAKSDQTIHFILEVKDNGNPSLTKFARVIVRIS